MQIDGDVRLDARWIE